MMQVTKLRLLALSGALALGLLSAACIARDLAPAEPHTQSGAQVSIQQTGTTKVDILFVIDNSFSMHDEQVILSEQVVHMAEELIHPTPRDGMIPLPVEDLHIGIVSTNMGAGTHVYEGCNGSLTGDNGALQNAGRGEGCAQTYSAGDCTSGECPWLSHSTDLPDDGTVDGDAPIWEDFRCVAMLGTEGCGLEQPMEAALVALGPQSEPGMINEGFLRDDSLLAIVFVTDEDDCSAADLELFSRSRDDQLGQINTRCAFHPEMLHPVDRYVEGFRALRPGREDTVVVAAIVGVPIDDTWRVGDSVDELRDLQRINPANTSELMPSCDTSLGYAFPPVRFAELVYAFENNGVLASICENDWTPALVAITRKIQGKLDGQCMPRELASTGAEACRVIETLFDDSPCPHPANARDETRTTGWHIDRGVDESGRRLCEILPADYTGDGCPEGAADCVSGDYSGGLQGWFYQSDHPSCEFGKVQFTNDDVSSDLSRVRFECQTALCPERRQCTAAAGLAEACDPSTPSTCGPDSICIRHDSVEVCDWGSTGTTDDDGPASQSCGRCSPTVGSECSYISQAMPEVVWRAPLVETGGCCAEGFHCESGGCVADRTTRCN